MCAMNCLLRSATLTLVAATCVSAFAAPHLHNMAALKLGPRNGLGQPHSADLALRMNASERSSESRSRRAAVGALISAAVALPNMRAEAMTEQEELIKLQKEAARIQGVFQSQQKANEGMALPKDVSEGSRRATAGTPVDLGSAAKPSPNLVPEEVVNTLLSALKNNDKDDSGLKTVLDFTSPENPILQNKAFFSQQMKNSKYSLLLGNFDKFSIVETEKLSNEGKQAVIFGVKIVAPYKTMLKNGVPFEYMTPEGDKISAIKLGWQLSKDPATGCWLSDTMYFREPQ
eukprot:CAMPEP_0181338520 /NCGR_PEP_ID=MMETSP1101-20121128/28684_1 /TAXON_ID=46948 /ORGANISM="Rhodomonas abbreviata, Strain Caron Lab Isolate" /LENGTH=287 /DNA_ID=CAMNT_0023449263 /DNA_START=41 /DNA_END=904 /DNA_ORIENTATION=-